MILTKIIIHWKKPRIIGTCDFSFVLTETQTNNKNRFSYHNLVIKTSVNRSDDAFPYFGLYRSVYQLNDDGELVQPAHNCDIPSAIDDFPGFIFPGKYLRREGQVYCYL